MFAGLSTPLPIAASVVLFGLGTATFATVTARAPAFNESLQVETITGSQRLTDLESMYDPAAYLYQVGYGYLVSEGLEFVALENPEEAQAHRDLAETYLYRSLRLDPANAFAWTAYGEALAGRGDVDGAAEALRRSKALGPTRAPLALSRLYLVMTLRGLLREPDAFADLVEDDMAVLRALAPEQAVRVAADLAQSADTAQISPEVLPTAGASVNVPDVPVRAADGADLGVMPPLPPLDPEIQKWLDEGGPEAEGTTPEN